MNKERPDIFSSFLEALSQTARYQLTVGNKQGEGSQGESATAKEKPAGYWSDPPDAMQRIQANATKTVF
jgi:hypothetical protein